ncbi:MAG TPA: hypothetical protein PLW97_13835, partial [Synergistaceae bacterium]|nr:hypothetical protein [Synergistaceae bacterium]
TLQSLDGVQEVLFEAFCTEMLRFPGGFNGTNNDRDMVAEYLEQQLLNPWKDGHRRYPNISAQSLGGALERVSRHVEILEFYDKGLRKELFYEHEKAFARERHIRGLENFASYLEGRARRERIPEERDRFLMEAGKRRERVFSLRQEANLGNQTLAEFVNPPDASERIRLYTVTPQEEEEGKEGEMEDRIFAPFSVVYSPDKTKIRIENKDLFEVVTLNFSRQTLRGDARIEKAPLREGTLAAWIIPQWDTVISLQKEFAEILNKKTGETERFYGEIPEISSAEAPIQDSGEEKLQLPEGIKKGSFSFSEAMSQETPLVSEKSCEDTEKPSLKNEKASLPSSFTNLSGNSTGNGG